MDEDAANRASQEIKALCRRLDPANGSHKDRIRRLNKFRNFVSGEGVSTIVSSFVGGAVGNSIVLPH
jgi:hypothetical protein